MPVVVNKEDERFFMWYLLREVGKVSRPCPQIEQDVQEARVELRDLRQRVDENAHLGVVLEVWSLERLLWRSKKTTFFSVMAFERSGKC